MYLSCLLIDVGANPDRPRPGRLWLRNLYRVHQRLCMAFPDPRTKKDDPDFLTPYWPCGFEDPRPTYCATQDQRFSDGRCLASKRPVHVARSEESNFLFRVDPLPGNRAMILVQSAHNPDWSYAFHNADYFLHKPEPFLAAPVQTRSFDPRFEPSQRLRFRLLANPVRKVSKQSVDLGGKAFDERWIGKDVPVPNADLDKWLLRRAEPGWRPTKNSTSEHPPGFKIESINLIRPGYVDVSKSRNDLDDNARRRRSALYEGVLEVTDTDHFRATIISGIGPGKAFGFGLLSVAKP